MNYKKVAGLGVLEWFILFVLIAATGDLYALHSSIPFLIGIAAGIISYIFAGRLKIRSIRTALLSSTIWLIIFFILDILFTDKANPALFTSWWIWFEYLLLFIGPVLRVHRHKSSLEEHILY